MAVSLYRFGSVRFGSVRFGSVRFGSVRFGSVRFGSVRFGSVQEGQRKLCVGAGSVRGGHRLFCSGPDLARVARLVGGCFIPLPFFPVLGQRDGGIALHFRWLPQGGMGWAGTEHA